MLNKKLGVLAAVVVLASVISVGLFVAYYPKPWAYTPQYSEWSGWKSTQQRYDGVSFKGALSLGMYDGFVFVGTDANGSVVLVQTRSSFNQDVWWQKSYGNGSGNAVVQTADGGFLVAGSKLVDAGTDVRHVSWLLKTNNMGDLEWSNTYEGSGFDAAVNDSDSNYVLLGRFTVNGTELPGLLKVDDEGNVLWLKTYNRNEADAGRLYGLISTIDGGYAMVGELRYNVNGVEMQNGWFIKTDAAGAVQVDRPFAFNGYTVLYSVAQTADGGYVLAGATANSTGSPYSGCLVQTDADGHSLWSRVNPALEDKDVGYKYQGVAVAKNGTLYVAGTLNGTGAVVEVMNATGVTAHYEIEEGFSEVNCLVTVEPDGYAFVGCKEGAAWLVEKYWLVLQTVAIPELAR